MVIFHGYVSLPDGKPPFSYGFSCVFRFSHGFPYGFPWMFIPPAMGTIATVATIAIPISSDRWYYSIPSWMMIILHMY